MGRVYCELPTAPLPTLDVGEEPLRLLLFLWSILLVLFVSTSLLLLFELRLMSMPWMLRAPQIKQWPAFLKVPCTGLSCASKQRIQSSPCFEEGGWEELRNRLLSYRDAGDASGGARSGTVASKVFGVQACEDGGSGALAKCSAVLRALPCQPLRSSGCGLLSSSVLEG